MLWLVLGHQADVNARVGELLVAPKTHSPTRRSMKPQLVGDNSEAVGYNFGATAGGSSGALLPRPWCGHLPHGDAHVGELPVTTTTQSHTHTTVKPQLVGDNSEAVGYNSGATAGGSPGELPQRGCSGP